jgi:hypothetical protein
LFHLGALGHLMRCVSSVCVVQVVTHGVICSVSGCIPAWTHRGPRM